ncbi:branched-chain amino acid transporter permease [Streptomyces sp. G35A]
MRGSAGFALRALPFAIREAIKDSPLLAHLNAWMPLGVTAILVVYCLRMIDLHDTSLASAKLAGIAATVAVQHLLGPDRQVQDRARRTESLLTETAAAVREGLLHHDDLARRHDEVLRRHDDLHDDVTRHTEEMRQLVETRLVAPDRAAEPYAALDRVRIDTVPDLAANFAEILAPGPPILSTFVRLEMQRVIGYMTDLTTLSVECPGENHDWMLALTRAAEQSICATSTSVDREFWNSEPASRYLHAQQEAIDEHGVPVRRLFLLQSARELDDRLLRLCEEQEVLHIEVRVAVLPELPPHLLRGTTNDFIVYDETVSFEIDQDLRDVNVRTRLIARQDHVQHRMKRFRELWEAGMSLRELEVRVDDEEDGTWMVDRG